MSLYADRMDAGRRLAGALLHLKQVRPLVLALPRGGVPVGFEVARILEAPLDLLMVRKIGVPGNPELALGAVVDGEQPHLLLNPAFAALASAEPGYIAEQQALKLKEIEDRRALYLRGRRQTSPAGRTVIIVDDGIATGSTMMAALEAVREQGAALVVAAVPVAPLDTAESLRAKADEFVCLATPPGFYAVGQFYADFMQTTDAEVTDLLDRAAASGSDTVSRGSSARE